MLLHEIQALFQTFVHGLATTDAHLNRAEYIS